MKVSKGIMIDLLISKRAIGRVYEYRRRDVYVDHHWQVAIERRPLEPTDDWQWQMIGFLSF